MEFISKDELMLRLGRSSRWVSDSLKTGRLFLAESPSGEMLFLSFFGDKSYNARTLAKVGRVLINLPGKQQHYFWTHESAKSRMTALEALAQGRTAQVVAAATVFARLA